VASRQLDRLELAALAYLCLPLGVFILGWLRWPAALGMGALLGLTLWRVVARSDRASAVWPGWRLWAVLVAVATVWVSLSGLGGGFALNKDWVVRMSVLRDLSVAAWPISYGAENGHELILRFSMAFYLVPALLGHLGGLALAQAALWLWTVLGTVLFLVLVLPRGAGARSLALTLAVVVGFSGLDVLGWLITEWQLPHWAEHIEWWATLFQYSSNTTLMFWVPNHALPAWIGAVIAWRHREQGLAAAPMALCLLASAAWSPLVTAGLAPLLLACSLRRQAPWAWLRECLHPAVLATLPVLWLLAKFTTVGAVAQVSDMGQELDAGLLSEMIIFALLEWAVLLAIAWRCGQRSWLLVLAALLLLVLPFLRFGPGNDIVMRGAIPSLTLVMMAALGALSQSGAAAAWRRALLVLLLIGAVTPLQEVARAFRPGPDYRVQTQTFVERHGKPWHYVGVLDQPLLQKLLREPVRIPP
jgi:hypothetical protein